MPFERSNIIFSDSGVRIDTNSLKVDNFNIYYIEPIKFQEDQGIREAEDKAEDSNSILRG